MYINTGAPRRDVIMPIGSSPFGIIVLAKISAQIKNIALNRILVGKSRLLSEPTILLTICGTINPQIL